MLKAVNNMEERNKSEVPWPSGVEIAVGSYWESEDKRRRGRVLSVWKEGNVVTLDDTYHKGGPRWGALGSGCELTAQQLLAGWHMSERRTSICRITLEVEVNEDQYEWEDVCVLGIYVAGKRRLRIDDGEEGLDLFKFGGDGDGRSLLEAWDEAQKDPAL